MYEQPLKQGLALVYEDIFLLLCEKVAIMYLSKSTHLTR